MFFRKSKGHTKDSPRDTLKKFATQADDAEQYANLYAATMCDKMSRSESEEVNERLRILIERILNFSANGIRRPQSQENT
jgi:hypothetical protein